MKTLWPCARSCASSSRSTARPAARSACRGARPAEQRARPPLDWQETAGRSVSVAAAASVVAEGGSWVTGSFLGGSRVAQLVGVQVVQVQARPMLDLALPEVVERLRPVADLAQQLG